METFKTEKGLVFSGETGVGLAPFDAEVIQVGREANIWSDALDVLLDESDPLSSQKRFQVPQITPRGISDIAASFLDKAPELNDSTIFQFVDTDSSYLLRQGNLTSNLPTEEPVYPSSPELKSSGTQVKKATRTRNAASRPSAGQVMSEIDKHQLRRIKNRESVEKCRQKRRAVIEQVERSVKHLVVENQELRKVAFEISKYISDMRAVLSIHGAQSAPLF
uniref:BZIP domain-containing protein n=1 Tax=Compsopogon caeruleus TaxID=31354 RepID=A0A6T6B365_9RHOD|mmetsp:Transcript_13815/g.28348  ORF Transcript_13815/g.28348 Transcript_13815/m.28348 type:complete len:221 (+) Transcript_13815:74-736(+)